MTLADYLQVPFHKRIFILTAAAALSKLKPVIAGYINEESTAVGRGAWAKEMILGSISYNRGTGNWLRKCIPTIFLVTFWKLSPCG